MHGTGTGLGDPIEIGAAAAALVDALQLPPALLQPGSYTNASPQPLTVSAAKSKIGHSEAASGVMGLTHAHNSMTHRLSSPVTHLTAVNPYLKQALAGKSLLQPRGDEGVSTSSALDNVSSWHLPRASGGRANASRTDMLSMTGISAFAFQGTNAFAVLSAGGAGDMTVMPDASRLSNVPAMLSAAAAGHSAAAHIPWSRGSFYITPVISALLLRALQPVRQPQTASSPAGSRISFELQLSGVPRLAWLGDHVMGGVALAPVSVLLEAATAACYIAAHGVVSHNGSSVVLTSIQMLAPLRLSSSTTPSTQTLLCTLQPNGQLHISSSSNISTGHMSAATVYHMTAMVALLPAPSVSNTTAATKAQTPSHLLNIPSPTVTTNVSGSMTAFLADDSATGNGRPAGFLTNLLALESALLLQGLAAALATPTCTESNPVMAVASIGAFALSQHSSTPPNLVDASSQALLCATLLHTTPHSQHSSSAVPHMNLSTSEGLPLCSVSDVELRAVDISSTSSFARLAVIHRSTSAIAETAGGAVAAPVMSHSALCALVAAAAESIIGNSVGDDEPLMDAGLDSLGAAELRNSLQASVAMELPATLVFDYPTCSAITAFLSDQMVAGAAPSLSEAERALAVSSTHVSRGLPSSRGSSGERVLVVGMSAPHASARPALLSETEPRDKVTVIPFSRWDVDGQSSGGGMGGVMASRFGVFLPAVASFDAALFGISQAEATTMDPQQRLLLHATLLARPSPKLEVEDAAAGVLSAYGQQQQKAISLVMAGAGVFVGIGSSDYQGLSNHHGLPVGPFSFTAASPAVASGRLAYVFGLRGPSASVDTACSSSLVATHMAAAALMGGGCATAITAGVMLALLPASTEVSSV